MILNPQQSKCRRMKKKMQQKELKKKNIAKLGKSTKPYELNHANGITNEKQEKLQSSNIKQSIC